MLALLLLTAVVLLVAFAIHKQKLRMGDEGLPFLGPFFDALVPTVDPLTPPSSPTSLNRISTPPTKPIKQSPPVGSDSLASTQVDVSPSFYQYDHLQSNESPTYFDPPPAVAEPVSVRLVGQIHTVVEPDSVRLVDQVQTGHVGDQTAPQPIQIHSEDPAEPITNFKIKLAEDNSSAPPEVASAGQDNNGSSRRRRHRRSSTADGNKRSGSSHRHRRHRSQGDEVAVAEGHKQPADGAPITDFKIKLAEDKPTMGEATGVPPAAEKRRHHHRHRSGSTGGRHGSKRSSSRRHRTKDGTVGEAVAVIKDSSNLAQEAGNQDTAGPSDQQQRRHRRRSASDRSRRRHHSTSNADVVKQDSSGAQLPNDAIPNPLLQDVQK